MLSRPYFLAVGMFLLASAVLASEPIFDSQRVHAWDQARDIFYVRRFSTGEVFYDPHGFAPPYQQYFPFTFDATIHDKVLLLLESVEKLPPAQMEEQPALRRLIFLRDLWAAFDGLHQLHNKWEKREDDKVALDKALARRDELRRRLARIMKRLELTEDEVREIPDAFQILSQSKLYPQAFDSSSESEPFFPTDLLDKEGPWVLYSSEQEPSAGGILHTNFVNQRSIFTLHLRTPDGREGGVKYLKEYTRTDRRVLVPPGTTLALLRRAIVPTREGKLLVSPLVESLQLIVVTPPQDQRFKFTFDRKAFLAGQSGLKPLGKEDPVDHSNFEAGALWPHPVEPRTYDTDGEMFVMTKYKTLEEIPGSLTTCVKCHHDTTGNNIFGGSGPLKAYAQSDPDKADATVVQKKEASLEWKSYLHLRTTQPK